MKQTGDGVRNLWLVVSFVATSLFLIMGCGGDGDGKVVPRFINHAPPKVAADSSVFAEASGCSFPVIRWNPSCVDFLEQMGCDVLEPSEDLLGGLDPMVSIAECWIQPNSDGRSSQEVDEIYEDLRNNGAIPSPPFSFAYLRYAIFDGYEFRTIRNVDELRNEFAPIESSEEALGFALAATTFTTRYGFEYDDAINYMVPLVEDTTVYSTEEGFEVLLFEKEVSFCGPYVLHAGLISVSFSGEISVGKFEPIYEDPRENPHGCSVP